MKQGKILYLNGVTSTGKTTLAEAIQELSKEFWYVVANDLFQEMIGEKYLRDDYWKYLSEAVILMYHTAKMFSDRGKNVIIDAIIVERSGLIPHYERVKEIFTDNPFYIVDVFCPLEICRLRNIDRGDRWENQSEDQHNVMAKNIKYNIRVETHINTSQECADNILSSLFNE